MKILLVDDEESILDLMQMVLRSAGHEVRTAVNGESALKALGEETFGLVITDLSMPKMDGLVLTKEIKARYPGQLVVLLTGYGEEDSPPPLVDHVLSKPVRIDALTSLVGSLTPSTGS